MMSSQRKLSAFNFIVVMVNLLALGKAQYRCVDNGNYTSYSTYKANLNTLLSSLSTNVDSNGFYNASRGQNPDRVNAIVLCRGDVQLDTCRSCIQNATILLVKYCPNQRYAVLWLDYCMLRYSNEPILGTMATEPNLWALNLEKVTSPDQFMRDLKTLVDNLQVQAASGGSLLKVAAGNKTGPDSQTIFALVQCTPDLSPVDCQTCLYNVVLDLPKCCSAMIGAKIFKPSCYLLYNAERFYNQSRLEELVGVTPSPITTPPPRVTEPPQPLPAPPPPGTVEKSITPMIIIVVGSVVAGLTLAVFSVFLLRKRINSKQNPKEEVHETVNDINVDESQLHYDFASLHYDFDKIKAATNDFSENNKLGQGGFGPVYKGKLLSGQEIAVKRLSWNSGQGNLEFKNEVTLLAKLQHRNLVKLLGFSLGGTEKLLVYEFVENASLDHFIFDPSKRSYLDWDICFKIIKGITRGLLYLHEDSRLRIIHRDLKASNVLLDGDMNPKIADFGMARLFVTDETQCNTTRIVGTYGYMAPEYAMQGHFSVKSDVFSFGVIVLEIISGKRSYYFQNGQNVEDLLSNAWKNWRDGTVTNFIDPTLRCSSGIPHDILRCIHIGLLCVQENVADRPTMTLVIQMLNSFSITLPVPLEPAFCMPTGYNANYEEYSSILAESEIANSSQNDVSTVDLYPR